MASCAAQAIRARGASPSGSDAQRPYFALAVVLAGALVAVHLGVGLVELRKDPDPSADSERWLMTRTPPDYQDRNLQIGLRGDLLPSTARALFVDDWIDTGGQALAARKLVDAGAATWCGASVIVDALEDPRLRRALDVKCLFRVNDL